MNSIWKLPSAWVPIVLSLAIVLMELWFISLKGIYAQQEADEGMAAHLFQLWLVSQAILIPFFAIKWFFKDPRRVLPIFIAQIFLVFAGCFPVFYFQW